jgi:hypothetical protein
MDAATVTIYQQHLFRGRQTLVLTGNVLKVEYSRGLSLNEYRFDLRGFLPHPTRVKQVALVRLVMAGFLTLLFVVLAAAGVGEGEDSASSTLMGMFILSLVVFWAWVVRDTYDVVFFQGPGGQFVLWTDNPNKKAFEEFLALLITRTRNAQRGEGNVLRQLRRAQIIDEWQYEQAVGLFRHNGDSVEST